MNDEIQGLIKGRRYRVVYKGANGLQEFIGTFVSSSDTLFAFDLSMVGLDQVVKNQSSIVFIYETNAKICGPRVHVEETRIY